MKKALTIFVILTQMLIPALCEAGGSFTGTFELSVTIPAIIGLNVPDPDALATSIETPTSITDMIYSNSETQFTEVAVVRNYQNITLRTLVIR